MSNHTTEWKYIRPISIERKFLRRPNCNILTIYRLNGDLDSIQIESALKRISKKHPLLYAHIEFNDQNKPMFVAESKLIIPIIDINAITPEEWIQHVQREHLHYFPLNKGTLSRILLVHYQGNCDLILNCHHLISDGLSCNYVLKDLLLFIADRKSVV